MNDPRDSIVPDRGLSGYLYKKTRNGTWQRRYFQTQGYFLTYYKNKNRDKLLAALSLPQVGDISVVKDAEEEGTFSLELDARVYILKANNLETAEVWVSTLNDLREQGISATKQSAGAPAPQAKATTSPGKQSNTASSGTDFVKADNSLCACCYKKRGN